MTPDEFWDFVETDEWGDCKSHALILFGIARAMAVAFDGLRALEIGTREGSTTIHLLAGLRAGHPNTQLVSVDNDTDIRGRVAVARDRVARYGFEAHWEFHLADSHTWQSPYADYGLIFIDGDHSLAGVEQDFNRFTPLLRRHGLVLMHDVERHSAGDANQWLRERAPLDDWQMVTLPFSHGLAVLRRKSDWEGEPRFGAVARAAENMPQTDVG